MKASSVAGVVSMLVAACSLGSVAVPESPPAPSGPASVTPMEAGARPIDGAVAEADAAPPPRTLPPPMGNTWSYLYGTYIAGASSPGHCGKAGCHQKVFHGFKCGEDKDTCYAGLVAVGVVNPSAPARSTLVDPAASVLYWVNPDTGIMPLDNAHADDQAAADFTAWVLASATNDAPDGGTASGDAAMD